MAISDFWNFEFLTSKISKNYFFLGKNVFCFGYKIQNFENFQTTGIYVKELVIFKHHGKFQTDMSIFGPSRLFLVLQHYAKLWRHIQNVISGSDIWPTEKLMAPLDFWAHSASETCNFFSKFQNFKIWPFLTWPWTWFRFFSIKLS